MDLPNDLTFDPDEKTAPSINEHLKAADSAMVAMAANADASALPATLAQLGGVAVSQFFQMTKPFRDRIDNPELAMRCSVFGILRGLAELFPGSPTEVEVMRILDDLLFGVDVALSRHQKRRDGQTAASLSHDAVMVARTADGVTIHVGADQVAIPFAKLSGFLKAIQSLDTEFDVLQLRWKDPLRGDGDTATV